MARLRSCLGRRSTRSALPSAVTAPMAGSRRSRKAVIPSRASAEANSRAESAVRSSASRSNVSSTLAVSSCLRLGQALRGGSAQTVEDGREGRVHVLAPAARQQADPGRLRRVEALAGEVVAGRRRAGRVRGSSGREMTAGATPMPHLGEGEGRLRCRPPRCRRRRAGPRPPARTCPVTRATTGLGRSTICAAAGRPARPGAGGSRRSAPAQNVLPVWVRTTRVRRRPCAQSVSASASSPTSAAESALRLAGASRVRVVDAPRAWYGRSVSSCALLSARSSRRRILPEAARGTPSMKSTWRTLLVRGDAFGDVRHDVVLGEVGRAAAGGPRTLAGPRCRRRRRRR